MNDYLENDVLSINILAAGVPLTTQQVLINYGSYYRPSISLNGTVTWEFVQGSLDDIPAVAPANIKGPGVLILGVKGSVELLPDGASQGDCYAVGNSAPYNYYIYDGLLWQNHGQLVGAYFTPTIDSSGNLSWSNTAGLVNPITRNITGPQGTAATITINQTTTLAAGSAATVENIGTEQDARLNIGIPQGIQGIKGDTGAGTPIGGTTGQILSKKTTTNYDTQWIDPPQSLPTGGTINQLLAKNSISDFDVIWVDAPSTLPTGGAIGEVLTKTGVDDFASSWKRMGYTKTFTATAADWTAIADGYSITIAAATHGMGADIIARAYLLSDTDYIDSYQIYGTYDWKITINTSGDIVLTASAMFEGKLVVK